MGAHRGGDKETPGVAVVAKMSKNQKYNLKS